MPSAADANKKLGDLLNVSKRMEDLLNKIEKNTSGDKKANASTVSTPGTSLSGNEMLKHLISIDAESKKTNENLKRIENLIAGTGLTGAGQTIKAIANISDAAAGIAQIAQAALIFALAPKRVQNEFPEFLRKIIGAVSLQDEDGKAITTPEKLKAGSTAISGLSQVLFTFPLKLVAAAPFYAIALPLIPVVAGTFYLLFKTFNIIGDEGFAKKVEAGVDTMEGMARGIGFLALGLLGLGGVVALLGPTLILGEIAIIGLMGGVFYLIGRGEKQIVKGAAAMGFVSLSIAAMGLSFLVLAGTLAQAGALIGADALVGFLGMTVALGIMASLFYIAGRGAAEIALGSLAFAAVGLSLMVLSKGVKDYFEATRDVMGLNLQPGQTIGETAGNAFLGLLGVGGGIALLAGLGAVFFVAGNLEFGVPIAIALGSFAMATVGLALMAIAPGITTYFGAVKNLFTDKDAQGMSSFSVESMLAGGAAIGGGIGLLIALGTTFAGAGIASPLILLGAGSYLGIGAAMAAVAGGMLKFSEVAANQSIMSYFDGDKETPSPFQRAVTGVAAAFAAVGAEGGEASGGLLGLLTGIKLGPNQVSTGIRSVLDANRAMTSVAEGLLNFQKNISQIDGGIGEFDPVTQTGSGLMYQVFQTVSMVSKAFGAIGQSGNQGTSLVKLIFGNDFKMSDTEIGIDSVMGSGKALTAVSEGLQQFNKMTKDFGADAFVLNVQESSGIAVAQGGGLLANIFNTISAVNKVFGAIGKEGQSTSVLSLLVGNDFGDTPVERGIASVRDLGRVLSGVASGLSTFAGISKPEGFRPIIGYNPKTGQPIFGESVRLMDVVSGITQAFNADTGIMKPFREIGENEDFTSGFLGIGGGDPSGPIGKGVKALQGIGDILSGVANSLKVFSDSAKIDFPLTTLKSLYTSVLSIITDDTADQFEKFSDTFTDKDVIAGLRNFTDITRKLVEIDGSNRGIFSTYQSFSNGVQLINPTKLTTFADQIKKLSSVATPFERFTKAFTQFSKDMGIFKDNFSVMDVEGIKAFESWTKSVDALIRSQEDKGILEGVVEGTNNLLSSAFSLGNSDKAQSLADKEAAIAKTNAAVAEPAAKEEKERAPSETERAMLRALESIDKKLNKMNVVISGVQMAGGKLPVDVVD